MELLIHCFLTLGSQPKGGLKCQVVDKKIDKNTTHTSFYCVANTNLGTPYLHDSKTNTGVTE